MKKTLISISLVLTTLLSANFSQEKTNICSKNYVDNIKNHSIYTENNNYYSRGFNLGIKTSKKDKEQVASLARYVTSKPYDSRIAKQYINLLIKVVEAQGVKVKKDASNVYNPYRNKKNKSKIYNPFIQELSIWDPIMLSVIFGEDEKLKTMVRTLVERFKDEDPRLYKKLMEPSYKTYLFLEKIDYFDYNPGLNMYKEELNDGRLVRKDIPWMILSNINKGTLNKETLIPDKRREKFYITTLNKKINACTNKLTINQVKRKGIKIEDIIIMYAESKIFKSKQKDLLKYYYEISDTNLWLYIDYMYNSAKGNYSKSARSLSLLSGQESHVEYLNKKLAKELIKASYQEAQNQKFFKSWKLSSKAIALMKKHKNVSNEDIDDMIKAKRLLRDSAKVIIKHFAEKNDKETAAKIFNKTDDLIRTKYNKKKEKKKITKKKKAKKKKAKTVKYIY